MDLKLKFSPLTLGQQIFLFLASLFVVSFGQPAWSWLLSMVAASLGYTFFFRILLSQPSSKKRYWLGVLFFTAVQLIQLSWFLYHPAFYHMMGVWAGFSFLTGLEMGIFCLFMTPSQLSKPSRMLALAGMWTIFEWLRLFFLSGYSWNAAGIALSANLYSLQMASLWGLYGLTFWVVLVNLLAIRAWGYQLQQKPMLLWLCMLLLPYVFGYAQLQVHRPEMEEHQLSKEEPYRVVLVQTGFPIEEILGFFETKNMIVFVMDEWKQILNITAVHRGQAIDLIVLPEFVVPFGTWTHIYPYDKARSMFEETLGVDSLNDLPPLALPFARQVDGRWMVSNAWFLQAIANTFDAHVVAGLEDVDLAAENKKDYYSSAFHFQPQRATDEMLQMGYLNFPFKRYDKRVLVPMGEYIPFSFLSDIARQNGVTGSFTPGKEAKVFNDHRVPFGVSICYEETFGHLMRESRMLGAQMMVNITSDAWFPNSILPWQHFYHARLRTVESGVPLIRACNTGITSGIDCLGQVIAVLGDTPYEQEWSSDSIRFEVPTYTYHTLYSHVGDGLVIGLSFFFVFTSLRHRRFDY